MADRLGDLLIAQGVVDAQQVGKALAVSRTRRIPLGEALVGLGFADEEVVWRTLARQQKLPFVDLHADVARGGRIKPELIAAVPAEVVAEHHVLPVSTKGDKLVLAVDDPLKTFALDTLQFVLNRDLAAALASPSGLRAAMAHYYGTSGGAGHADLAAALAADGGDGGGEDDAPIIRLVTRMIGTALEQRASDIHVEPLDGRVRVRFRMDGVLQRSRRATSRTCTGR